MTPYRTTLFALGVCAAVFFYPWVTALCIVALAIRYRAIEAVGLGALLDFLWLPHDTLLTMVPLCTIVSLIVVWGFEPLRLEFLR